MRLTTCFIKAQLSLDGKEETMDSMSIMSDDYSDGCDEDNVSVYENEQLRSNWYKSAASPEAESSGAEFSPVAW